MVNVRKVRVTDISNFQGLLLLFVSCMDVYQQFGRCDYVFDMYPEEPSVNDSEIIQACLSNIILIDTRKYPLFSVR